VKNSVVIGHSLRRLFEAMKRISESSFILNIGGDHSIGSASILGRLSVHSDLGVIWVDAHGDCNTPESSESKNYHGMPAAHAMGWFSKTTPGFEWMDEPLKRPLNESKLVYIGLRDLDPRERDLLRKSKVHIFTMKDIDRLGIAGVMTEALKHLPTGPLHLSFDIDAIDPSVAPGTGTLARGGLSYRESHYICESLADSGRLVSMDMVEVNPKLDTADEINTQQKHLHGDDPRIHTKSPTVRLAIELVTSALGKNIL
jgi:arginase